MDLLQILKEKWSPPKARTESFTGQTVLVTGTNTGLGLEAAKKIVALNATTLIFTTRSHSKADATKKVIEASRSTTSRFHTRLVPLILDMSTAESVRDFVNQLKETTTELDAAILNAGLSVPDYRTTADGFEETIAVNTVNTILLADLLLPLLTTTARSKHVQTHMTVVSSRAAITPMSMPAVHIIASAAPVQLSSEAANFPPGIMGGFVQYGRSKLYLEYALRRLVKSSSLYEKDGKPLVILNSVEPGMTKSDFGRNYDGWIPKLIQAIMFAIFAKSAAAGANAYLTALSQKEESMGQLWVNDQIEPEWTSLTSEDGKRLGENIWKELQIYIDNVNKQ